MILENAHEGRYGSDVTNLKGQLQKSCQVLPLRAPLSPVRQM